MEYSVDQAEAYDKLSAMLMSAGVDIIRESLSPLDRDTHRTMAIVGKAGSGKTLLLFHIAQALKNAGVKMISGDYETRINDTERSLAVLAPTNKAASILCNRGIQATTIHRILYIPLYDPKYEQILAWLNGTDEKPEFEDITGDSLDRVLSFFQMNKSIPGALAAGGLRGSDFIIGWKRREDPLDIALIDECSMLEDQQLEDIKSIFSTVVLFGDPAQLAPVGQSGKMVFDLLPREQQSHLMRVHRQKQDNPILSLAHALGDPDLSFSEFEKMIADSAKHDERVVLAHSVRSDFMARSPVLVWRNVTRIRLIQAFRNVYNAPADRLISGEPLICDGIELPLKHRKKRIDLEARGLIKGAQCVFLNEGRKLGFSRLHVLGLSEPQVSVASIIKIESPNQNEPFIPFAAKMGATFIHGAACTIHKAQGSQWPVVQVFAPDLELAARIERIEAGIPLWKRLAYVAITRAIERLFWVKNYRLTRPKSPLSSDDLRQKKTPDPSFVSLDTI